MSQRGVRQQAARLPPYVRGRYVHWHHRIEYQWSRFSSPPSLLPSTHATCPGRVVVGWEWGRPARARLGSPTVEAADTHPDSVAVVRWEGVVFSAV